MNIADLIKSIRDVPDFPQKGVLFKDITTLLKDKEAFPAAVDLMAEASRELPVDLIVGIESRGFIFGAALAYTMGVGFAPIRKKGKLPAPTTSMTYQLEYGEDTVEIHDDAIRGGMHVLIVDDLLATGGTAEASAALIEKRGGKVSGFVFLIELDFLKGRQKLESHPVHSLIHF